MESFVPACVWVKEKQTARNWMGYKVYTPFSGLPQHALCRSYHPVKQSTIFVTSQTSRNQSACSDGLTASVRLPGSWFTRSFCLHTEWSASFTRRKFEWHSQLCIHWSKHKNVFPKHSLCSSDCLGWEAKQSDCLSLSIYRLSSENPFFFLFFYESSVTSSWKVPGVILVLQPAAGWTQIVAIWKPLLLHIAPLDVKTRACGYTFLTSY